VATAFLVATYNVLAQAYVRPDRYARVAAEVLDPGRRRAAVVERVAGLGADVICLQEVEQPLHAALTARLAPAGYQGRYARKAGRRPDGCSLFSRIRIANERVVRYADGSPPSGHLALIVELEGGVRVACTHVRWDAPDTTRDALVGLRQVCELVSLRRPGEPWILAGDFNAGCEMDVVREVLAAGFRDAHENATDATFAGDGTPARIDFLFHTPELVAGPLPVAPLPADAVLPCPGEPSDHLPVAASMLLAC
jgi:endonuclease/exonuclease/phosphatase family metal-dependent hydrolase